MTTRSLTIASLILQSNQTVIVWPGDSPEVLLVKGVSSYNNAATVSSFDLTVYLNGSSFPALRLTVQPYTAVHRECWLAVSPGYRLGVTNVGEDQMGVFVSGAVLPPPA